VILQAIPDSQGGIVAIGKVTNASGDNGMIWHMTTAGSWQQVQFLDDAPPEFSSIACQSGVFVASSAGGSRIMYSTDGNAWQAGAISVGSGFALTVETYHYGFVAVGTDAARQGATTAWTSLDGRTWTSRTDWHLPPNVTALFGMGTSLVATAKTAVPTATPTPTAPPTPTPSPPAKSTTWWWSATGVAWQQSGLETSSAGWSIVNRQILLLDAPVGHTGEWTAWSSIDGRSWRQPVSNPVSFAGSKTCTIASRDDSIIIVSWDAPGDLKDYYGQFS
jgi:hypothetical protein